MPSQRRRCALLAVAFLLCAAAASQAEPEGHTAPPALPMELNAATLVTALAHQSAVVLFHTRWCVSHPQLWRCAGRHVSSRPSLAPQVCPVHSLRARVPPRGGCVRELRQQQQ